jgi:hypothetical protein
LAQSKELQSGFALCMPFYFSTSCPSNGPSALTEILLRTYTDASSPRWISDFAMTTL